MAGTYYIEKLLPGIDTSGTFGSKVATIDFASATTVALPGTTTLGSASVLTLPTISGGLTATGSVANDFSGSTGTFKTSTGAVTIGNGAISITGAITLAANIGIATTSGTGAFDFSNGSGIFKTSTGAATFGGSSNSFTNAITSTGGITPPSTPTAWPTGFAPARSGSEGTDTTPVVTETYFCEIFIPTNCTLTGLSVLNGSANSGNINVGLANNAGAIVASSATTTAGSGTNAYQQIPFSTTYSAVGPAKYFAVVQYQNTTARYRTYPLGNFGAAKKTSETYGTFTSGYTTTTFATAGAIIASTY